MRAFILNDLETINGWLLKQGKSAFEERDLPKFGMIIEGVAVGFLAVCEGSTCFLEAFVTNPEAPAKERHLALYKIACWLIGVATASNFKQCLLLTNEESLLSRSKELGFEVGTISIAKKRL